METQREAGRQVSAERNSFFSRETPERSGRGRKPFAPEPEYREVVRNEKVNYSILRNKQKSADERESVEAVRRAVYPFVWIIFSLYSCAQKEKNILISSSAHRRGRAFFLTGAFLD